MRSFEEIKNIPSFPGIYAFKGAYDRREEYSYVGMTNNLKERVSLHLIKKDSSIVTGSSTISINQIKFVSAIGGYIKILRIKGLDLLQNK